MQLTQRFTLLVKNRISSVLDSLEDPERSLNQLIVDMEEQLEVAKRAAAQAIANEDRLRSRIAKHREDAGRWQDAARRALVKQDEDDGREALRRAEIAERQARRLADELAAQEDDTAQIRESINRMHEQLRHSRSRLQVLHARLRQGEARRAMGKVMRGAETANLYGEFERLGERVELQAAEQNAYLRLGDELSGDDFRRRLENDEVDDSVEKRLARLRAEVAEDRQEGDAK